MNVISRRPGDGGGKSGALNSALKQLQGEWVLVLDADGLNRLALATDGWQWLQQRQGHTWLTPHAGEFRRLFPQLKARQPLDAALEASRLCGAAVLLKGAHSVVADPSGAAWQLGEPAGWVARSGLGDLLAGYAAGLGSMDSA